MNGIQVHRSIVTAFVALMGWSWLPCPLRAEPRQAASSETKAQSAAKKIDAVTRTIAGRVFDAHGRPLAEACVWLIRQDDRDFSLPESTVIAESQSRPDGRFDLMPLVADLRKHADDPTAECEVWVWKPGFAVGHRSFYGERIDQSVSIFLGDDSPFDLLLKNPKGLPCEGATATPVVASLDYSRAIPKPLQDHLTALSTRDGHVEISGFSGRLKGIAIRDA